MPLHPAAAVHAHEAAQLIPGKKDINIPDQRAVLPTTTLHTHNERHLEEVRQIVTTVAAAGAGDAPGSQASPIPRDGLHACGNEMQHPLQATVLQ